MTPGHGTGQAGYREAVADPWAILGLRPGASLVEARAARRRLAKQLHPDLHGGVTPAERIELARRMVLVNQALAEVEAAAGRAAATAPPNSTSHSEAAA